MKNYLLKLSKVIFVICLLFGAKESKATHIIGGEISYTCLGNNNYEITFYAYRDCYYGLAPWDDPACLGVFDASGNFLDNIKMDFNGMSDTIFNQDPCLFVPPSVCVERYIYKGVVNLPLISGGYIISYQRCCRNQTISNIVLPDHVGATYDIAITEEALKDCNSSPKFKEWPPVFICVNTPLIFDHSAVDVDGDTLRYSLTTPYIGGVYLTKTQPCPPDAPPYLPVVWNPGYGEGNMLGHIVGQDDQLRIDSITGQMYAVPPQIGQFVVGVTVTEYRNGEIISVLRRDFQYNVVQCSIVEALFEPDDDHKCGTTTVSFTNNSTKSTTFDWTYNDIFKGDGAVIPFSNIKDPTFTFPDTGSYNVCLIVEKGSVCSDTICLVISMQANALQADFDISFINCLDSLVIQAFDKSFDIDSISSVVKWNWKFTTADTVITSTLANPIFGIPESAFVTIELISETELGCIDTITKTFQANILDLDPLFGDTLDICKYESVQLNPQFIPEYTYSWTPSTGLTPPCACTPDPIASPGQTTVYTMSYTDSTGLCHVMQDVTVLVLRSVDSFDFKIKFAYCSDSIKIVIDSVNIDTAVGTGPLTWNWVLTSPFGTQTSTDPVPMWVIHGSGFVTITGTATTLDSCAYERKISFQANVIPEPGQPTLYRMCTGDSIQLYPTADPGWIYKWSPNQYLYPSNMVPSPLAYPPSTQEYTVIITDSVGLCFVYDSVLVVVTDSTVGAHFTYDVLCDGHKVNFTNTSTPGVGNFTWEFGDPDSTTSNEVSPMFIYKDFGTYTVTLTTADTNVCKFTESQVIMLMDPQFDPDFTWQETDCSTTLEVQFTDATTSKYASPSTWVWQVNGVQFSTEKNPKYTFPAKGTYQVTLFVTFDNNLCDTSITKEIVIDAIINELPPSVTVCFNQPVFLNPGGNTAYTYIWSPCNGTLDDCTSANPLASPPFSPVYYVTITDTLPSGIICEVTDSVIVEIDNFDPELLLDQTTCDPVYNLSFIDAGADSVIWKDINGNVLGTGNPFPLPINQNTQIIVCAISDLGCVFTDTFLITKMGGLPNVTIEASPNDSFCTTPFVTQLTATFDPDYTYKWNPSTGLNFDNIFNPIATVDETATYSVLVTDENACTASASITITKYCPQCAEPFIFVPSAFSPNGDNKNDELFVRGEDLIESMELIVYNRWGQEVWRTTSPNSGWDGTFKGEKLRPDVLGFYLKVKCIDGQEYIKKGNVSIIR